MTYRDFPKHNRWGGVVTFRKKPRRLTLARNDIKKHHFFVVLNYLCGDFYGKTSKNNRKFWFLF